MDISLYEDVVRDYSDTVYRIAFLYMKNAHDADDCCQNTFIKLYKSNKQFENKEHIKAWLITVVRNECRSIFNGLWHKKVDLSEEFIGIVNREEKTDLINAILSLSEKYRDVLYLHYYEGYKVCEIAKMFNLKESNVKVRLMRGREALKRSLLQGGYVYE